LYPYVAINIGKEIDYFDDMKIVLFLTLLVIVGLQPNYSFAFNMYEDDTDVDVCKATFTCRSYDVEKSKEIATKRNLNCYEILGFGKYEPNGSWPSNKNDETLCQTATMLLYGKRRWNCNPLNKVFEAIGKGLSCGVGVATASQTRPVNPQPQQPKQEQAPKSKPEVDKKIISASSGSGFAVSSNGYLVTNNHVIEGCQEVYVHRRGKKYQTDIVSYDQQNDLALLKGDFQPDVVLPLTSAKPQLAQDVYVSGYPFGLNISSSVKVTKGIISSLTGIGNNLAEMQIDAALQSGNSGGPILDEYGNVVGVAVAKLDVKFALENFGAIPENTNFGVKVNIVEALLDANGVNYQQGKAEKPSGAEFSNILSNGTYYISCWMTLAQIEAMKTKKVMFSDLQ
jgi:S1-C subfamily serine protease